MSINVNTYTIHDMSYLTIKLRRDKKKRVTTTHFYENMRDS